MKSLSEVIQLDLTNYISMNVSAENHFTHQVQNITLIQFKGNNKGNGINSN